MELDIQKAENEGKPTKKKAEDTEVAEEAPKKKTTRKTKKDEE